LINIQFADNNVLVSRQLLHISLLSANRMLIIIDSCLH